jgi:hypothetical protein
MSTETNDSYISSKRQEPEVQLQSVKYALSIAKREGRKYLECLLDNPHNITSGITELDKKRITAYISLMKLSENDVTRENQMLVEEKIRWTLWSPVFAPENGYDKNGYSHEGQGKQCNKCMEQLPSGSYVFPNGTSISLIDLHATGCKEKPVRPKPNELLSLLKNYWAGAGK